MDTGYIFNCLFQKISGNNTPIFFIRDPLFFPSFIHTQKRNPQTHLKDANMFWDFISLRPETSHQVRLVAIYIYTVEPLYKDTSELMARPSFSFVTHRFSRPPIRLD